jgi:precorrin-2/cobalt-factor-2 C20-methyltransferase
MIEDKMTKESGVLYGLGVGPGDPELLTLKAARVLNSVDIVYAAASTKNSYSLAVSIAKPHIPDRTPVAMLHFPMSRDTAAREAAWRSHAERLIDDIRQGKRVAFITLGDSMTYSTYGYVLQMIKRMAPELPVISVPGITSYQAGAASLNQPLVEGEESMLLLSGAQGGDHLRAMAAKPDTVVFLKAYRNMGDIVASLEEADRLGGSTGISHCSLPAEEISHDIREFANRKPAYWTLIISKKRS